MIELISRITECPKELGGLSVDCRACGDACIRQGKFNQLVHVPDFYCVLCKALFQALKSLVGEENRVIPCPVGTQITNKSVLYCHRRSVSVIFVCNMTV